MNTLLKQTLAKAQELQAAYDKLGAKSTQNIRNPFSLPELLLGMLPTLPDPDSEIELTKTVREKIKLTPKGKSFIHQYIKKEMVFARTLPTKVWKRGKTIPQIISVLSKHGYFIKSYTYVHRTLNDLMALGMIGTIAVDKKVKARGRKQKVYFTLPE